MTPKDRAIAREVANHTVARMIDAATDKELTGRIVETWLGHMQQIVGRAVLRLMLYILLVLCAIASVKLGLAEKFTELMKR